MEGRMKGIILAGGSGTRLAPMTGVISKQLLPIYDKPMLYYPLSVLMMAGVREICIISTPRDLPLMQALLGDGKKLGLCLEYLVQEKPQGIAQAFILAADFIGASPVCLILGDNLFYGQNLIESLQSAMKKTKGATVFAYRVNDPERYGVVTFNVSGEAVAIDEKPKKPTSSWAVTGIYVYDAQVVGIARKLKPSARGELEITDINRAYLKRDTLRVEKLGRGVAWLDTGTPDAMLDAAQFIRTIEARQGLKIACIEEVALRKKYITVKQAQLLAKNYRGNAYGQYLEQIIRELDEVSA
jgi:glucose-1-phosphate thymidylyltransferase